MDDQTVVGVANGAAVFANAGGIGIKPETPNQLLAILRLTHEQPIPSLTWTRAGLDRTAAYEPGALITEATLPYGGEDGPVVAPGAMITLRARNLDRTRPCTSWSSLRRVADALICPDPAPPPWPVNAVQLAALAYGN